MSLPADSRQKVSFGDFEVDLLTAELRTNGHKVTLRGQPFQILMVLLERPRELVTREELKKLLWTSDTFVDFEHSLNKALGRLREALRDSAEQPKFVETIPRKGYRWIGPGMRNENEKGMVETRSVVPEGERASEIQTEPQIITELESFATTTDTTNGSARSLADQKRQKRQSEPHPFVNAPEGGIVEWRQMRWRLLLGLFAIAIMTLMAWFVVPTPAPKILSYTRLTSDREKKFAPLVTDGTRLYFMMPKRIGWTIAEASASGGETLPITSHFDDIQLADISPNGSQLLIGQFTWNTMTDVPIYILPLPAGLPHRVGDILAHDASWSPNGEQIVYARGNDLARAMPDGSESHHLVSLVGPASYLRWSPDGKILRFTVSDLTSNSSALWEVASDGTGLRPLLPDRSGPNSECCGNWTPDGKYFVFQSDGANSLWAIRERNGLFRRGNSTPIPLTTGQSTMLGPVPSRDGKKLFAIQSAPMGQLVRQDAKSKQFLPYLSGISAIHLDFSKDGQWVAYSRFPDATLWRSKTDGTERLQLTFSSMEAVQPTWSPDGKQIAFAASLLGKSQIHVYVVSADGGTPVELTKGDRIEFHPNWSRNGDSLLFCNALIDVPGAPAIAIHELNLKSKQITTLIGSEGKWYPRISPDGNYIAALSKMYHLMLFDVRTQKWASLTQMEIHFPNWSRDAKYLYFNSAAQGEPAIYRVQIKDHKLERVTSLKDVKRPTSMSFGSWTGLAPDDSPLALQDISTYEIYAMDWQLP